MAKTTVPHCLRALGRLLGYPDDALRAHLPELRRVLCGASPLSAVRRGELAALCDSLQQGEALEHEADYVQLFDRGRATSLHLFEHVHGDSRDRGPAMVDLLQTYEQGGLFLAPGELPDYLPVVLEFVSTQPPREARAFLGEIAHLVNALHGALQQRHSLYAAILGAVLELAGAPVQPVQVSPDEPIDKSWEEPAVFAGCASPGQTRTPEGDAGVSAAQSPSQPIHIVRRDAIGGGVANARGVSL